MKYITGFFWNSGEKRLRSLWRILFQSILLLFFAVIFSIPILIIDYFSKSGFHAEDSIVNLISSFGMAAGTILSLWICSRWVDWRPFSSYGFHLSRRWIADLAFGLFLGAFLMGFIFGVEYFAGWVTVTGFITRVDSNSPFLSGLFQTILLFLMVGFYEESFFRGYQLRNMAEGLKLGAISPTATLIIAWILSSSIFGFLHLGNPNASMISTINLVLAGLFLGLGFVLTGDLAISIGLHITWNFFQGNVFGFPVSGTTPIVSFIGIHQKGSELITGGAFGPEAGLVGLAAILLGSILILAWVYTTRKTIALDPSLAVYSPPQ
jgi:membrane protease YdiL (CAAX protease family)